MNKLSDTYKINRRSTGKSHNWYTPDYIIKSVYEVLGEIDLDPASDELANELVKAKQIFTKEDNGLIKDWIANTVYLNYPGGKTNNKSNAELWFNKAINELDKGNCAVIMWAGFSIEQLSIVPAIKYYPTCIFRQRIKWIGAGTQPTHQNYFSLLFNDYSIISDYLIRFEDTFSKYGDVGSFVSLSYTHMRYTNTL